MVIYICACRANHHNLKKNIFRMNLLRVILNFHTHVVHVQVYGTCIYTRTWFKTTAE